MVHAALIISSLMLWKIVLLNRSIGDTMLSQLFFLNSFALQMSHVGSRYTCNPPPVGTDFDVLILIPDDFSKFESLIGVHVEGGFRHDGSDAYGKPDSGMFEFRSYSRDELNLIVTSSDDFYNKFMAATSIAKRFNLLEKADRVALFRAVLYGERDYSHIEGLLSPALPTFY